MPHCQTLPFLARVPDVPLYISWTPQKFAFASKNKLHDAARQGLQLGLDGRKFREREMFSEYRAVQVKSQKETLLPHHFPLSCSFAKRYHRGHECSVFARR